jgi:hypothetical protein
MKKIAILFIVIWTVVYSQDPYDFFWNQSYNNNGTKKITINLTLETHMPVDEIVTIEFWKSGAENSPYEERTVPWYSGNASGRSFTIMTKVGANQWQAIVDLDTTLVSANATSQSMYNYFYGRNTGNQENKNIEYSRTGDMSTTRRLDFGWHTKASLVQEDTLTAWFAWPTDGVMPTIDTSTYLSAPPSDINTTTFMAGGGMNDFWRAYWNPFIGNYLDNMVRNLNANWIMFVPGPKIIQHHPTVTVIRDHDINSMPEQDIKKVITEAHKRGLKVFWYTLAPGSEEGNYDHSKVDAAWYVDYANAMRPEIIWQATLAETHGVEMIGFAPYPTSQLKDEHLATIDSVAEVILNEVRAIYSGKIAIVWVNETPELDIYGKGDYLNNALETYGLQHFGLTNTSNPSVSDLLQPMRNKVGKMKPAYTKYGKPFVYSFIQSASYDGMVAANTVITEANEEYLPDDTNYPLDFQEQADGIEAMQQVIGENDWIAGAFYFNYKVWAVNWKSWNIRGKPAQKVAAKWWRWHAPNNVHLTTSINDEATVTPFHKGGTLSLASGSYVLSKDTTVTVTATADSGYKFIKWTGDASGTSPSVTVSMDTDKAISAIFYKNLPPSSFTWISPTEYDSISIDRDNLTTKYSFKWTQSIDVEDLTYNINDKFGNTLFSFTDTVGSVTYEEILSLWPEQFKILPRMTLEYDAVATDGEFSTTITGGLRKLYINRYDYLSTEGEGIPTEFALHENYPNPFNPTTTLRFDLPEVTDVTVTIYNMLGQRVRTFNMNDTPAGYHSVTWNATNDYGDPVGAGVYLYQLRANQYVKTRKMVLLK